MPYLVFLDDKIIRGLVKNVLDIGRKKKIAVKNDFRKNVIDPFASLFDAAVSEINHDTWKNTEMLRQCQKTLTNHIGSLHQKILGHVDGWVDLGNAGGVDLVCREKKIIAEVKNKFNTVSGGKLVDEYHSLERLVTPKASQYKGYTSYFVNIITQKPERFDKTFEPSDKDKGTKCTPNDNIRIIDGASFYTIVTGREHAIEELYDSLSLIIEDIFHQDYNLPDFSISDKKLFKEYFDRAYKNI